MRYRRMGASQIQVSVIGHGTWGLGNDFFGEVDEGRGIRAIHQSLDMGVNLVDTAPAYGENHEAEIAVGKALKGRRGQAVISTKFGVHRIAGEYVRCLSPKLVRYELENSLRRLDTDYIDIYMVHWPDNNFGIEGALELLEAFRKEGKIREAAVSNFNVEQIALAQSMAGIVCVQPPCSLLDRSSFENGIIPYCEQNGIGVMTYGSLGGGILSGAFKQPPVGDGKEQRSAFYDYFLEPKWSKCNELLSVLRGIADARGVAVAEVSINWVLAQPGVTCALMGSSRPETAMANARAADWELTAEELSVVNQAYERIMG